MATYLDYRDFREQRDYLQLLHDEWMANSTGTSNTPQGEYDGVSGPYLSFHNLTPPLAISGVGFSPSDMRSFLSTQTDGSSSGSSQGGNNNNKGGGRRTTIIKRGGGGGHVLGPNALGGFPKLGNVPYQPQSSSGMSPAMLILMLGGGGLLIYFIWHKLRKSKAEDKEMTEKGE